MEKKGFLRLFSKTSHMTPTHFRITLDKPCSQNWDALPNRGEGKFCEHCSKTLLDFTSLSDEELFRKIRTASANVCGRVSPHQLNRNMLVGNPERKASSFWNRVLAAALLYFLGRNPADAATSSKQQATCQVANNTVDGEENKVDRVGKAPVLWIIKGRVIDSLSKEPLPYTPVSLKGTKIGVMTDVDGKFYITVPDSLQGQSVSLVVKYIGYHPKEMVIQPFNSPVLFELQPAQLQMMGALAYTTRGVTRWEKIKHPSTWRKRRDREE
jgi:hypothetical protein